jgi:hypothetical protein
MAEENFNEMSEEEREEERRRREEQDAADRKMAEEVYNNPAKTYFESTPEENDARVAAAEQHLLNEEAGALNAETQEAATPTAPTAPKPDNHQKSVGDPATGGGIVVGTGMRKADDRSWEKDYNAMLQRKAAARAGRQAAADERQRLLDSGMYFDDGRGNIKLKKEYREHQRVGNGGRRTYNETRADDGAGMRSIRDASRTAYDTAMGQMISSNREEMNHKEMRDAMTGVKKGEGNIAIYKGLVTALDSLKNSAQTEDETADFSNKDTKTITVQLPNGKTEQRSVDPRYDYDQLGRVIGMAPKKKTGLQIQSGFVGRNTINVLNSQLQSMGDDRRITGIIARRKVNPMFPDKASEPFFLVQGVRYDPATKQNVPWGETFDPKRAYELGKSSGKNAGLSDEYSDDNLISTWGDVFGVGARREAEAKAKNAGFEHKRMIDLEKVKTDRLKVIGDIVPQFLKTDASEKADAYILKNLPREAWDALLAPTILKDENGNAVMDETTGKPVMEPLSTEEVFKRMDKATDWAKRAFGKDDEVNLNQPDFISYVMSLAGITPPESVSSAARTAPTATAKAEGMPKEAAPASAPSNVQPTATQGQATLAALQGKAPVAKAKPDAHAKEDARRRANAQKMASPKDKEAFVRGARMELERRLRKQANTNANATSNVSGQLKVQSRFNTDEVPMLPEERRAEIAKRWYDWAEQQRATGNSISKEEVERLIDKELNDTIG